MWTYFLARIDITGRCVPNEFLGVENLLFFGVNLGDPLVGVAGNDNVSGTSVRKVSDVTSFKIVQNCGLTTTEQGTRTCFEGITVDSIEYEREIKQEMIRKIPVCQGINVFRSIESLGRCFFVYDSHCDGHVLFWAQFS